MSEVNNQPAYDLDERTAKFGEAIIDFFIPMVVRAVPELREEGQPLWKEAKELNLIFAKIGRR